MRNSPADRRGILLPPPGDMVFPGGYNIPGSSAFPGDIVFYLYVHHCARLMAGFDIGLMESHTQAVWVRG